MAALVNVTDKNGNLLAIIVRSNYEIPKSHFINEETALQNVGFIKYKKGDTVKPHLHPEFKRVIYGASEVVIIKEGKLKLYIYDNDRQFVEQFFLQKDDMFILSSGGHSEDIIEDTTVLVIKQGPYIKDKDKISFEVLSK